MAKVDKLITDGEKRINIAESEFARLVKASEEPVLKEIQKLFDVVSVSGGKLQTNKKTMEFLVSLQQRVLDALKKSGYNNAVADFIKNFDDIKQNNIGIQREFNKVNISQTALSDITNLEIQNTITKLTGSGISKDFIIPIQESLYRNILLGADINEAQNIIHDYIVSTGSKNSALLRYSSQVARDSLTQYDGAIQAKISNILNFHDFIYAGSLIIDSRPQCRYWVDKVRLRGDELKNEIAIALRNGILPGQEKPCSGMIPFTTVDTFSIFRGGYNCRHRAIVTKF
jgi:hypothetical protein